jgi:hypothetical protein
VTSVEWPRFANRTQGRFGPGGRLTVSGDTIAFHPFLPSRIFGAKPWTTDISLVRDVDKAPRDFRAVRGGGLRPRLRITMTDGSAELFVVRKVDNAVRTLREVLNSQSAAVQQTGCRAPS